MHLRLSERLGLGFGPNEKQQLLQGLPLKGLAEIYGPLRIQHATFDLMREEREKRLRERWFTGLQWEHQRRVVGTSRTVQITVDPFTGIFAITVLDDRAL